MKRTVAFAVILVLSAAFSTCLSAAHHAAQVREQELGGAELAFIQLVGDDVVVVDEIEGAAKTGAGQFEAFAGLRYADFSIFE